MAAFKESWRIAKIALDEDTILWRNADVEQERRAAIYDLIEENVFKPVRAVEGGESTPRRAWRWTARGGTSWRSL